MSVGAEPYVRHYIHCSWLLFIYLLLYILYLHWLQHLSAKWGCLHEASRGRQGGETPGNHAMSHKVWCNSCLDPNHCSNLPILLINRSCCCCSIETPQSPPVWEFYPQWMTLGLVRHLYRPEIYWAPPRGGFVRMQAYVIG